MEYELQTPPAGPPVFLLVVDTCLDDAELEHLRDSLQQVLQLLPEQALVGLVTFGTHVMVHELSAASLDCARSYVFRGSKEYTPQRVQDLLGIVGPAQAGMQQQQRGGGGMMPGMQQDPSLMGGRTPALGRFLCPVGDSSFALERILEDLQRDSWPVPSDQRPQRCTGAALSVATGLLESAFPRQVGDDNMHKEGGGCVCACVWPPATGTGRAMPTDTHKGTRGTPPTITPTHPSPPMRSGSVRGPKKNK